MTQEGSVRVVLRIRPLQIASSDSSSQLEQEEVVSKVMSMENAETEVARVYDESYYGCSADGDGQGWRWDQDDYGMHDCCFDEDAGHDDAHHGMHG